MKDFSIEPNTELHKLEVSKREMLDTVRKIITLDEPISRRLCRDHSHEEAKRDYFILKNVIPTFEGSGTFETPVGQGAKRAIEEILDDTHDVIETLFEIVSVMLLIEDQETVERDIRDHIEDQSFSLEALRKSRGYIDSVTMSPNKN